MAADEPLPGILAEVEKIVGREKAIRLEIQLGGRQFHVPAPEKMKANHPIAIAVGLRMARKISTRFQGELIYLPKPKTREKIIAMREQGCTSREISLALGITVQAVRYHLRST